MVLLNSSNIPSHSHTINFYLSDELGDDESYKKDGSERPRFRTGSNSSVQWNMNDNKAVVIEELNTQSHYNMPPYVALYFCERKTNMLY